VRAGGLVVLELLLGRERRFASFALKFVFVKVVPFVVFSVLAGFKGTWRVTTSACIYLL
jgi:hypothetical protein